MSDSDLHHFWAKLGDETWPDRFHPVLCHLIDVGLVARQMWDRALRSRMRNSVTARLGLDDPQAAGAWLAFWVATHDLGKISPGFQHRDKRTEQLKQRLISKGYDFPSVPAPPHGKLSTAVLAKELESSGGKWPAVPKKVAANIAVAVGGHHGLLFSNWDQIDIARGNTSWATARREMLIELACLFGITQLNKPDPTPPNDQSIWMFVAGLTSVADWIGSNVDFFPPAGDPSMVNASFDKNDYFGKAEVKALIALERLGWLGRVETSSLLTFAGIFPFQARPLQEMVVEISDRLEDPSLLIVEAPMGEGKTEAAWYAAARWDRRGGQGVYVALPTMATSNQMFDRVAKFLGEDDGAGKKNLMLQHGKASLNEQFEKLKYAARVYDDERNPSAVVAEDWFATNKKHGLLAPSGVGTIDQALLAVLQTKHVFVRLFGLAGKCVILDEVHAYDTYMTTLMERLLRWLAALGCQVVLLSATLPRDRRQALIEAYAPGAVLQGEGAHYPRLTIVRPGNFEERHMEADPARARTVKLGWLKENDITDKLSQALANGGCAVVIRNTVGLAQQTYIQLRDGLEKQGFKVELFHARFPFGRRMELENAILARFGKNQGPAQRNKQVLVATQVVEQSLDLDFDLMITDLAPVDLVLQRAGRLHRHERGPRPESVHEPWLWLIEPEEKDGVPHFGVNGVIYSSFILFRSLLTLCFNGVEVRRQIHLPSDIDAFVDQVYSELPPPNSLTKQERDFWAKIRAKHEETIAKEKSEAESRYIKKPHYSGALVKVVGEPREEDSPNLHPAHQALTRLTRPTVSLICLNRDEFGAYRLPHDNCLVATLAIRNMSYGGAMDIGRLMQGEVTCAHWGIIKQLQTSDLRPKEWSDVGMLCRHHLISFTEGKSSLGDYDLELDYFLGLTVVRSSSEGEDE